MWRVATAPSAAALHARSRMGHRLFICGCHVRKLSTATDSVQPPEEDDDQKRARQCLGDLNGAVRGARTPQQLTSMWTTLSTLEPVHVVARRTIQLVGSRVQSNDNNSMSADTLALRMVAASELLSLIHQGRRHTVVEETPRTAGAAMSQTPPDVVVSPDRVLLVSEQVVAKKIVGQLFRMRCYLELAAFVKAFETWVQTSTAITHPEADVPLVEALTTLGDATNASYIASLGQLDMPIEMLVQFKKRRRDQGTLVMHLLQRNAFYHLLSVCVMARDGGLARSILDEALDTSTLEVFNRKPFTLALQACLRGDKSLDRLEHAWHIYRRVVHEIGYIATPAEWCLLINVCARLGQHERAIELFRAYMAHGVLPFQRRFTNALVGVCDYHQYDLAVEMARMVVVDPLGASSEAEAMFLNKLMSKLLRGSPSRDHVEQVLLLLQLRRYGARANVLRDTVAHFFRTAADDDRLSPETVVTQFISLWARIPATIKQPEFILRLVVGECDVRGWHDQRTRVIAYAREKGVAPLDKNLRTRTPTSTVQCAFHDATPRSKRLQRQTAAMHAVEADEQPKETDAHPRTMTVDAPCVGVMAGFLEKVVRAWKK